MVKRLLNDVEFKEFIFDIIDQLPITQAQKDQIKTFLVNKFG